MPGVARRGWCEASGFLAAIAATLLCAGCRARQPAARSFPFLERFTNATAVSTNLVQLQQDDGQWVMPAKNYASTRFSTLDQINASDVKNLKLAWTFSTCLTRGHEAAPLVVNNTMYVVTPWPNLLYALDLTQSGAPMKWVYQPNPSPAAQGVACCDVVNRGAAYYNGRIYYNTLDVQTVAVDANTGKQIWKTRLGDINLGESITMAPIVVKGRVLVGNSGGEFGVRGWLAGVDADSGKISRSVVPIDQNLVALGIGEQFVFGGPLLGIGCDFA